MADEGMGAPLSRRVPGEARPGPGQSGRPVLPDSVLNRMQAAIDAEHGHAEGRNPGEPNTEPLPRVTGSGSPGKHGPKRAPSPSGIGPDIQVVPDPVAKPRDIARPPRSARSPRAEEPLRVAKALRATLPELLGEPPPAQAGPPPAALAAPAAEPAYAAPPAEPAYAPPAAAAFAAAPAESAYSASPAESAYGEPAAEWPYTAPPVQPAFTAPPAFAAPPAYAEGPDFPASPPRPAAPPRPAVTSETGPTPGSIGWLWPDETAVRGGGGRGWKPPSRFRYRTAMLVALGAVVLAGAGLFIGISLHSSPVAAAAHTKSIPKVRSTVKAASKAASTVTVTAPPPVGSGTSLASAVAWITHQVLPGTFVACDIQTCAALTASGFSPAQEVQVGMNSQSLSNASLVLVTPQLRMLFTTINPSLSDDVAAAVLASFGQVTVQPIYPGGAPAYQAALSQDVQGRIQLANQLLNSGQVTASPAVRSQLAAGDAYARVLLALQSLADQHPIDVVGLTDQGPGAGPGIPFRGVQLALADPASGLSPPAYQHWLVAILRAHTTFPGFSAAGPVPLADGTTVAQLEFYLPVTLGLLN